MELVKKLNKIQQKLAVPKNQTNNFGNYNYRSCEDILEAVKPSYYLYSIFFIFNLLLVFAIKCIPAKLLFSNKTNECKQ